VIHSKRSGVDHTVLPANYTTPAFPSCAFTRCHHHSNCGSRHPIAAQYSFIDPERSWPSWLTHSGWLTHISGQAWSVHRLDVNSYWLAGIVHNFLSRCATLPHWRGRTPPLHPSPISTPRILHQLFDLAMPIITLLNAFQTSRKFANLTSREMEIF